MICLVVFSAPMISKLTQAFPQLLSQNVYDLAAILSLKGLVSSCSDDYQPLKYQKKDRSMFVMLLEYAFKYVPGIHSN